MVPTRLFSSTLFLIFTQAQSYFVAQVDKIKLVHCGVIEKNLSSFFPVQQRGVNLTRNKYLKTLNEIDGKDCVEKIKTKPKFLHLKLHKPQ